MLGGKYANLTRYLENSGVDEITLSFAQIADIAGGLPPVAYKRRECWSNGGYNSLSYGWLNAGYTVSVDFEQRYATFSKGEPVIRRKRILSNRSTLAIDSAVESIRKFHTASTEGTHTRIRSWEHCYKAFRENRNCPDKSDDLCLHLAWYLASWGMLRNSFLQRMNHRIHMKTVQIVLSGQYDVLFEKEHTIETIPLVLDLSNDIQNAHGENSVTDTLITKILLGIFGCAPAYDRFFRNAATKYKVCSSRWGEPSLTSLWQYYDVNRTVLDGLRHELVSGEYMYPPMKLMDMCLWQLGFDQDNQQEDVPYGEAE